MQQTLLARLAKANDDGVLILIIRLMTYLFIVCLIGGCGSGEPDVRSDVSAHELIPATEEQAQTEPSKELASTAERTADKPDGDSAENVASPTTTPNLPDAARPASKQVAPAEEAVVTAQDSALTRVEAPVEPAPPRFDREALASLPLKVVKPIQDHYPNSNDGPQKRLVTEVHEPGIVQVDLPAQATPAPLVWRVSGPVQNLVIQAEDQPAMGDLDGLIAELIKDANTDREKADALFVFVRDVVTDWWYPAERGDLSVADLNALIWNYGYGFCYDLGRLQAGLWAKAGLRSRIVGWPQHTVAEVYYDDAWHLYDLQHHSYYETEDGTVASFEQLKNNPALFYTNINAYGLDAIGYPAHHMAHWYSLANPNFQDSADGDHWESTRDFRLDLRHGEMLEILWAEPGAGYHPESWVIYYGMKTKRKDAPYTVQGRLTYGNKGYPQDWRMVWRPVTTPTGTPGFAVTMDSPFIVTEGFLDLANPAFRGGGWIKPVERGATFFTIKHGKADLTAMIAGLTAFDIIVEAPADMATYLDAKFDLATVELALIMSPIGLPSLKAGVNRLPFQFDEGKVYFSFWYKEHAPSLRITDFRSEPANPKPGEDTWLTYTVRNDGSGRSLPTDLTVFNNVTAFLSETTERVGIHTVPPIDPGQSREVTFYWQANTRMTWYGQNPYVQLLDAWLDLEKDTPTADRRAMRRQDYLLLHQKDGTVPDLPGYGKLP